MTIGSLFSGIGGLEFGLEAAGFGPVIWQVEQDAFCRAVLSKHWPGVDRSVTDVRAAQPLPRVDLVCGGFPCQDVSGAGKGAGLAGERSGLWFVMRDTIAALRPRAVVVENVASGKRKWLCQVRTDLHAIGYRTRAVQVSAAECGAPHRRERVFVLALGDTIGAGLEGRACEPGNDGAQFQAAQRAGHELGNAHAEHGDDGRSRAGQFRGLESKAACLRGGKHVPDAIGEGGRGAGEAEPGDAFRRATEPGMGRELDGLSGGLDEVAFTEWVKEQWENGLNSKDIADETNRSQDEIRRMLDLHRWPASRGEEQHDWEPPSTVAERQPDRRARLKALGNAVVPHQARVAGLVLQEWLREVGS